MSSSSTLASAVALVALGRSPSMNAATTGTNDSRSLSHSSRTVALVARASSEARNRCSWRAHAENSARTIVSMFSTGVPGPVSASAATIDSSYISSMRAATAEALFSK